MRPKATACMAAMLAAMLGGCGTVVNCINLDGAASRAIYGGVRQDASNGSRHVVEAFSGPAPTFTESPKPPSLGRDLASRTFCIACGVGMLAIDLPMSAVTDTLTLPVTVPATLKKKNAAQKANKKTKSKKGKPASADTSRK